MPQGMKEGLLTAATLCEFAMWRGPTSRQSPWRHGRRKRKAMHRLRLSKCKSAKLSVCRMDKAIKAANPGMGSEVEIYEKSHAGRGRNAEACSRAEASASSLSNE